MSSRRRARTWAASLLFQLEFAGDREAENITRRFWEDNAEADAAAREFADDVVRAVRTHKEDIDRLIKGAAENWELERIGAPERNLLRMAVAEIFYLEDVPPKVSINEAIELAKIYGSSPQSHQFVNGVLDAIYRRHTRAA